MCGILCITNNKFPKKRIETGLSLMNHRGPDSSSSIEIDNNYFGHVRLSIIDINERSNQPFSKNKIHIIYNGEVYNYKELIVEHKLNVQTESDTEVVLEMYRKYGEDCLKYFNGMFVFVIYDENKKDIFVARDRLGIKPLYYRVVGDSYIFSSEISSILNIVPDEFDEFGLRQYKKMRMTLKGYTVYKNIKMFPPGHYWINGKEKKYWDLEIEEKNSPTDETLVSLIKDSVRLRKRADVPIGSYLSGGLDSTVLSYILKPTHTWTVGFESLNEFNWSELANSRLKSNHHKTLVTYDLFKSTAKWMVEKRKEPLSVPNEVLLYLMTKDVKKENTVILSGEGADELFWGYDRIFKWARSANELNIQEFDKMYCYGSHSDDEVIDFVLEGMKGNTVLDKVAYFFQIHHLHGLLRRVDNSTMLCSVEARVPFVDHRLVEMMAGTPFEWRMGDSFKEPLKRNFKDIIPIEVIQRKKIGFPVPLDKIFLKNKNGKTPMDSWLSFNLNNLFMG
ncbi:asparagine synthase (glutamine-hydrolyzing) [candidate division KSB1 bacterium]|nr:asparagine synthase (glutamine-hydrolyzing) [candidate division KSB1 bacterium]